jgi:putative transposase
MARLPRLAVAGGLHHIGLRAHDRARVFSDDVDRAAFATHLREAALQHAVAVHAYTMLDSEVQLLATPARAEALGRLMQSLGRRYTSAFNRRHERRGALWDGRYRCNVLEPEAALLDVTVLIETLPVERGMVSNPGDWPWSSAAHHLGQCRDPLVSEHPSYWIIGNTPFERELAHANLLRDGVAAVRREAIMHALQRGHPVGTPEFVAQLSEHAGRPLAPRPRGRPRRR